MTMKRICYAVLATVVGSIVAIPSLGGLGGVAGADNARLVSSNSVPIVIGGVAETEDYPGLATGFAARIARFNRAGGIDGRKIKFLGVQDDGGNATTDLKIVQGLVLKSHVFAVAPIASTDFEPASSNLLVDNKTPYLGWGFQPGFCGSKFGYGFNGCLINPKWLNSSLVDPIIKAVGKPASQLRVALQGQDSISVKSGVELDKALFQKRGAKIVYDSSTMPTSGTIDYAPYVQAILASKPDVVYIGPAFTQAVGLIAALRAAGYTGAMFNYTMYLPGVLQTEPDLAKSIQGTLIDAQVPPQSSNSPAIKQMVKDLQAIGKPTTLTIGTQVGYWSADIFIQMLQATAAKGPLTSAAVGRVVNAGFSYKPSLKGSVGPLTFPQNETRPAPCAALVQVKGTNYSQKVAFACYQNIPG